MLQVLATHPYRGEDEDELTFEGKDIIYVVEYDDPDEQVGIATLLLFNVVHISES